MILPAASRPAAAETQAVGPRQAALVPPWETLPNGALVAEVDGYRVVVRRGVKGRFRFVVLAWAPDRLGMTGVTSGSQDTAERAMAEAERAVAGLPPGSPPRRADVEGQGRGGTY